MQTATAEQSEVLARFLPVRGHDAAHDHGPVEESKAAVYRVLIMERSTAFAKLLAKGLATNSMTVDLAHDMNAASEKLREASYQLLILDLDAPDMDGATLLQELRASWPEMKILVLSGHAGVQDLVNALDCGADDCLAKPLSLLELMARVRALRRRTVTMIQPLVPQPSKLVLHRDQCRVERDGRTIDLTPREVSLLEFMMEHPGETLSRSTLSQEVWNMPAEANTNIVDVYIKYLRDKLDGGHDEKLIRTVRGIGYLFQAAA